MKKGLVLGLAGLFLLTGCGNKVKCTSGDTTITGSFKKGVLYEITEKETYKSKDDAKSNCTLAKAAKAFYKNAKVKCGSKYVSMTLKAKDLGQEKMTKEEFKKTYCKK